MLSVLFLIGPNINIIFLNNTDTFHNIIVLPNGPWNIFTYITCHFIAVIWLRWTVELTCELWYFRYFILYTAIEYNEYIIGITI